MKCRSAWTLSGSLLWYFIFPVVKIASFGHILWEQGKSQHFLHSTVHYSLYLGAKLQLLHLPEINSAMLSYYRVQFAMQICSRSTTNTCPSTLKSHCLVFTTSSSTQFLRLKRLYYSFLKQSILKLRSQKLIQRNQSSWNFKHQTERILF